MTYHLEPWIEKIISPIILIYPDGTRQEHQNGKSVEEKIFSETYQIKEIRAINSKIEISLRLASVPDIESFF